MTEEERHNNKAVYNGEQKIQYTGWFQSKRSIRSIVISMLHEVYDSPIVQFERVNGGNILL